MSDPTRDPLEEALAAFPREVSPARDLWPRIQAEIASVPLARSAGRRVLQSSRLQLAAGLLLMLGTALTTHWATRESIEQRAVRNTPQSLPAPALNVRLASASFGSDKLGAEYLEARAELDKIFQQRLTMLPPAARAKIERNLADLRHAAHEISATLAEHPSDPLLQDLLMSTYQSELQLLADVSETPVARSMRTDL